VKAILIIVVVCGGRGGRRSKENHVSQVEKQEATPTHRVDRFSSVVQLHLAVCCIAPTDIEHIVIVLSRLNANGKEIKKKSSTMKLFLNKNDSEFSI
jgi:hypothetical protein